VFHAGTALRDGEIVTAGGRVLAVTAMADTLQSACDRAYAALEKIHFDGIYFRRDIAHRALKKIKEKA
jgi:phosphoribosylamine--glycine ligase